MNSNIPLSLYVSDTVPAFHYAPSPALLLCAGCAAERAFMEPKLIAETEVGPLKVCGAHVDWALRKLGHIEEADADR